MTQLLLFNSSYLGNIQSWWENITANVTEVLVLLLGACLKLLLLKGITVALFSFSPRHKPKHYSVPILLQLFHKDTKIPLRQTLLMLDKTLKNSKKSQKFPSFFVSMMLQFSMWEKHLLPLEQLFFFHKYL